MDIFALKKLARNEFFSEIINFPWKLQIKVFDTIIFDTT